MTLLSPSQTVTKTPCLQRRRTGTPKRATRASRYGHGAAAPTCSTFCSTFRSTHEPNLSVLYLQSC